MNDTGAAAKPLFIWAGGKNKMLRYYQPHMPIGIKNYCEPFFGGGAMFVHVMKNHRPKNVIINDINKSVMSIYESVCHNFEEFLWHASTLERKFLPLEKIDRKKFYMDIRHYHAYEFQRMTQAEEAATLFFLLKTSFNGIYQHNKNTNGRYGTPAGLLNQKNKVFDKDNLLWWHHALQGASIKSCDWRDVVPNTCDDFFTFLDPPYRGCFTSYAQQFSDDDQKQLAQWANGQSMVMLCNRELGDGFWHENAGSLNLLEFDVTYTAGRRKREKDGGHSAKKAKEVLLWRCDG